MMQRLLYSLFILAAVGLAPTVECAADQPKSPDRPEYPFQPGERLEYVLRWTIIPAGRATLEVHPIVDVNGEPAFHFRLTARTNAFVDSLYKVRDKIDAFTDTDMTRSVRYLKKQHEGTTRRNEQVEFNWEALTMRYTNSQKADQLTTVMPGSFDPLSAFYYVRCNNLAPNATLTRPVTDGKKNVVGYLRIVRRETITVNDRAYDTLLVEPDLTHIKGVFEQSKDATLQLWLTADHRRIPVRVKSKVAVGSFVGELVTATGLTESAGTVPLPPQLPKNTETSGVNNTPKGTGPSNGHTEPPAKRPSLQEP